MLKSSVVDIWHDCKHKSELHILPVLKTSKFISNVSAQNGNLGLMTFAIIESYQITDSIECHFRYLGSILKYLILGSIINTLGTLSMVFYFRNSLLFISQNYQYIKFRKIMPIEFELVSTNQPFFLKSHPLIIFFIYTNTAWQVSKCGVFSDPQGYDQKRKLFRTNSFVLAHSSAKKFYIEQGTVKSAIQSYHMTLIWRHLVLAVITG